MDRNTILISGSCYITHFKSILDHFGLTVYHALNLRRYKNQTQPVVLDHPLGLVRAIRAESSTSMNYLKASWLAFLQGEEAGDCWDAFCPWLWSINYVHAKLEISTFAIEDYQPSGYLMPFYLKVQIEQPRHFLLRVGGAWSEPTSSEFEVIQNQIDQLTKCMILCVELVWADGEWQLLQIYPGLPWGHFLADKSKFMPIFEQFFCLLTASSKFAIPLSHRPFCNKDNAELNSH